ncbi:hypothetical protein ILYODFUR_035901, partial [Ilyodon furcidens]
VWRAGAASADLHQSAISRALRGVGIWRETSASCRYLRDLVKGSRSVEDSAHLPIHPPTAPSLTAERIPPRKRIIKAAALAHLPTAVPSSVVNTPPSRKSQSLIHEDPELLLIWSASKPAIVIHSNKL